MVEHDKRAGLHGSVPALVSIDPTKVLSARGLDRAALNEAAELKVHKPWKYPGVKSGRHVHAGDVAVAASMMGGFLGTFLDDTVIGGLRMYCIKHGRPNVEFTPDGARVTGVTVYSDFDPVAGSAPDHYPFLHGKAFAAYLSMSLHLIPPDLRRFTLAFVDVCSGNSNGYETVRVSPRSKVAEFLYTREYGNHESAEVVLDLPEKWSTALAHLFLDPIRELRVFTGWKPEHSM